MTKPTVSPVGMIASGAADVIESMGDRAQAIGQALDRCPHTRSGVGITDREGQIMTWRLPNGNAIQMYINPENFVVRESKLITSTRTKGGFVIQYWGDNLTELSLSGTTGSSGVKGINVLRDIYRSENKGFDLVAAQQLNDIQNIQNKIDSGGGDVSSALTDAGEEVQKRNFLLRPSLAALASNILLFYQGDQWRGYFTTFSVTESVGKLGLFEYSLTFMAYEKRGMRKNFMPWHREPLADDMAGNLINGVGNKIRGAFGLNQQPPQQFHPSTAPYTFGGNSLSAGLGYSNDPITEQKTIFI
jgi:hypothetical protein